jgi:hypothetical protein
MVGWVTMVKVRFAVAVCAGEPESVTLKVNGVALTVAVGVPLIRPDDAVHVNPAGRLPEVNCQLVEPVPPVDARVVEYVTPTAPFGSDAVVIVNWGTMVSVRFAVAVCAGVLESVNLKLRGVALTAAVGVPLICPVEPFNVNPAGSVPAVNCHAYGAVPPMAPRVWE